MEKREPLLIYGTLMGALFGFLAMPAELLPATFSLTIFDMFYPVWGAIGGMLIALVIDIGLSIFRR